MPRQFRGRRKIPFQGIENEDDMYASFSKRRASIFKSASILNTTCKVDVGLIVLSPKGIPHSFFSPSPKFIIDRYENPKGQRSDHDEFMDTLVLGRVNNLNKMCNELREDNVVAVARTKVLKDGALSRGKKWWEDTPVEQMSYEQVQELITRVSSVISQITNHMEQLELVAPKLD